MLLGGFKMNYIFENNEQVPEDYIPFVTPKKIVDNTIIFENLTQDKKISILKQKLLSTDYQAIKFAEGQISAEEYEPIKKQRQEWRDEINELEKLF